MSRQKKYSLILDCETSSNAQIVYNIGYVVVDNYGNIAEHREFYTQEVYANPITRTFVLETAFYNRNAKPRANNLKKFWEVCVDILELKERYNIKEIYAYNCAFDKRVMKETFELFYPNHKYPLTESFEWKCIWSMACQTICKTASYRKFCEEYCFVSDSGNYITNAEVVFKYLTNDITFKEEHLALADVYIEAEIFWSCLKTHKKMDRNIIGSPWRMAQPKYFNQGA